MELLANVSGTLVKMALTTDDAVIKANASDFLEVKTMKSGQCFVYKGIGMDTNRIIVKLRQPQKYGM